MALSQAQIAEEGTQLTAAKAQALEQKLLVSPKDFESRIRLLGYYSNLKWESGAGSSRRQHVLWVIENRPESEIAGMPYAQLDPQLDGQVFEKAKAIWLRHIKNKPKSAAVLGNAAQFFRLNDEAEAEELLTRVQLIDPKNANWPKQLGELYMEHMWERLGPSRAKYAPKALAQIEKAVKLSPKGAQRFYLLFDAARTACEAGDVKKTSTYASELLSTAPSYRDDWNYANAIHYGNTVLGRAALKSGDLKKSKEFLIAAGKAPASGQLETSGPSMSLAAELLDKGEKDAVLQYIDLCGSFWITGKSDLASWKKTIEAGGKPDFSANLN